jgi:hypothetical protein
MHWRRCREGWGRIFSLVGLDGCQLMFLLITPLFRHVEFFSCVSLTAAFIRIQGLADERRWTASGIDILRVSEEG